MDSKYYNRFQNTFIRINGVQYRTGKLEGSLLLCHVLDTAGETLKTGYIDISGIQLFEITVFTPAWA